MKKLPLALGALAISTISAAGMASPTWAKPVQTLDYNTGDLRNMIAKVTRVNPRANNISIILNKFPEDVNRDGFFQIVGLGAAEDRSYELEVSADGSFIVLGGSGWRSGISIQDTLYSRLGVQLGVETVIPSEGNLQDNTSKVIYYTIKTQDVWGWVSGKIDYSMCVDSTAYKEADAAAGDGDVLDCRAEITDEPTKYRYVPYLNGTKLEVPADEVATLEAAAQTRRNYDYEPPLPEVRECEDWDEFCKEEQEELARILAEREAAAKAAEEAAAEEARKAAEEEAAARAAEEAAIEAKVAQRVAEELAKQTVEQGGTVADDGAVKNTETEVNVSDYGGGAIAYRDGATDYRGEVTMVTSEGSAYQNSENTGVTNEYATNADVWAVDDSKVWEDDSTEVGTPELGEEDCGHFWPLVAGWGLAVLGWGSVVVLVLKKRK